MKKTVLWTIFIVSMLVTGTAFANLPNTNYDEIGRGAIGIELSRSAVDMYTPWVDEFDYDTRWNLSANAEVVVAPRWAVGFNYMNNYGNDISVYSHNVDARLKSYDFTLQYMAYQGKGFSLVPYVGWTDNEGKVDSPTSNIHIAERKSTLLLGTKLVYDFNKQLSSYADIGLGNNVFKWGIGVAYKFKPNMALSVGYDYREVTGFEYYNGIVNAKVKRLNVGLTYLF